MAETPASNLIVLVLGATGYVGGRLVPTLLEAGHRVRCLARSPEKLDNRPWRDDVEVLVGDLTERDSLPPAFDGVDVIVYLVHSLGAGEDFQAIERSCAENTAEAAADAGVDHIVYLSGLGDPDDDLSPHLHSRQEVGRRLAAGPTPVTELRAAVILGSGSASFEMLRGLVEVLPVMITPRWVQATRVQPIAIRDVIDSLDAVLGRTETAGVWEIGGADVMSYADLMQAYARAAGLRRRLIVPVPVLTPRLSTGWVDLVTPLPGSIAAELVLGLQNDVVVTDRPLTDLIPLEVLSVDEALDAALSAVQDLDIPTRWRAGDFSAAVAIPRPWDPDWSGGDVYADERATTVAAPAAVVMEEVRALGGEAGWHGWDALWGVRGALDDVVGGPGRKRGRRHPTDLEVGDTVDVFVVERSSEHHLRLRAEMKMPGFGWLEWRVEPTDPQSCTLTQTARFVPKGVAGRLYWLAVVPFHALVFGRMVAQLRRRAESRR